MSINNSLASAARRIVDARRTVSDPPPVDAHVWRSLVSEVRTLDLRGDHARALGLIDGWVASELAHLGMEPPEEASS